jgi:hypothetical protein
MRKLLVIGLVAGGAALTTVTSSATASSPVVPLRVQQAIKKRVNPLFAYVPESIPPGYHYLQWIHSRGGLTIWFAWHRDRDPQLGFNVGNNNPCPSAADPMRVFRFGGFKVYWSRAATIGFSSMRLRRETARRAGHQDSLSPE